MRARQNFFLNRKVHEIYYLLCVWNIFISIELIIVNGYEMCVFFYNFSKKIWFFLENFQNLKIFKKIEFSRKNFKLQIALKNLLFELWPNKKICNEILSWRLHFQKKIMARAESHIAVKIQKSRFFGISGKIFWARARKCARAKNFFRIEKFIKFCTSYILLIFLYYLNSLF